VPYHLTKKIVKSNDFFLSVNLGLGVFFYLIYHQSVMLFINFFYEEYFWYFFVAIPILGYFALIYFELLKKFMGVLRFLIIKRQRIHLYARAIYLRSKIVSFWDNTN
jgi:hypothetical protein